MSGQEVKTFVYEDLLKGFNKGAGDYSHICILESFWRIHWKEERLEAGIQLGDKCNDLR